ncbi:MAG: MmgE/PrpD family protein [Dehalococcoidia bacterium]|tara:strand:+ start:3208 stop:4608 length:1401 start_codon:yes stop_codon:yes gene_type:complete
MSISQELAKFTHDLEYNDLQVDVVDKVKAIILHGLFIGLSSVNEDDAQLAAKLAISLSDNQIGSAHILATGNQTGRLNAAYANSILIHLRGQDDSYRMLTHPGCTIIPAVLAESEGRSINGKEFLTAVAAAYEVHCRLSRDTVPSAQNQGFRSSALFGIFGPAIASAKIQSLSSDQIANTLALAVSFASGNLQTSHEGTKEMTFQEGIATQNGMMASRIADLDVNGAVECFEGPAGFLRIFTGIENDKLNGSFDNQTKFDLATITEKLGTEWRLHDVTMKIYSGAGFVQPVIDGCAALAIEHDIDPASIKNIHIEMNEWETVYPSPKYPRPGWGGTDEWKNAHFAASAIVNKGYESTGRRLSYGDRSTFEELPEVQRLTKLVTVEKSDRPQYGPKISISLNDGNKHAISMTGDEFKWDFTTEKKRIQAVYSALPFDTKIADEITNQIENINTLDNIDRLIELLISR